ncbi:MAG: hypothetical protein SWY16_17325 [Cyanobacteriota bacterium]|nr:hypothetical protein [Cyanobacteriota bacterium]
METKTVKFILKLLGFVNYRASISDPKLKPNSKTSARECQKICRELCNRGWVARTEEVKKLNILLPGKSLLNIAPSHVPISEAELQVLQASAKGTIAPGKIKNVPPHQRQEIIQGLIDRGFIEAVETKIKEVWLTELGKAYLRDEFHPKGTNAAYSGKMLDNYVCFLRQSLREEIAVEPPASTTEPPSDMGAIDSPSDDRILETIRNLDRQLGTDNYLPIFHLRQKLPMLSRDELDAALYRLQRNDRLEMSSLTDTSPYTNAQIEAGIPQNMGGPLFFLMISDRSESEFAAT